jgi:OmpA-OmpF porin, OOP family
MKRFVLLVIFSLVFIATSAQAADKGMYVSVNGGLSFLSDSDTFAPTFTPPENLHLGFDSGFNVGGAVGYNFGNIRAEGEIAYHTNDIDELSTTLVPFFPATDGSASALSFMVNGYYDFHIGNSAWVPYLGVGAGAANVDVDLSFLGATPQIDDNATVFAYQLMAGLGFNISSNMTLTAGYRYFAASDPEIIDVDGNVLDVEYSSHEVNLGVRYNF